MKSSLPIALLICKDLSKVSFFKNTLKGSFHIIHAEDSDTGLEWLKSSPIEIVLLESQAVLVPLQHVCSSIQKTSQTRHIPILLIANSIKKTMILEALQAGVSDFLHEPLDSLEVHERIAVCLQSKLINKKMKMVTSKIKSSPLVAQNSQAFLDRTLIRDKTLETIAAAKKGSAPLSIFMVHLDASTRLRKDLGEKGFKEVLSYIETLLQGRLRTYDTLMIEGAGQYLMLLPKTSQSAAKVIAEDIRKEVATTSFATSVREVLVTVSIGVVSFDKELSKSAKAFEQFDLCLTRVKESLVKAQKKGNTIVSSTSK